jgi:osmotically-inducible protein OsmY
MKRGLSIAAALGVGAGLMYFADPELGKRRRAMARGRTLHAIRELRGTASATSHDLGNRGRGMLARVRTALTMPDLVTDDVLVERVRSRIGRVVSHPHALEVKAEKGRITLRGPMQADEARRVLKAAEAVRGVTGVENALTMSA